MTETGRQPSPSGAYVALPQRSSILEAKESGITYDFFPIPVGGCHPFVSLLYPEGGEPGLIPGLMRGAPVEMANS
jgi:hypothetical protein